MRTSFKSTIFSAIMVLGTWLSIEIISIFAYGMLHHTMFSHERALTGLDASIPSVSTAASVRGLSELKWDGGLVEALHPYFGFVADPDQNKPELKVSDYGFVFSNNTSPIVKRSPDKIVVGLFGGSFSKLCYFSLKSVLENHASALGKEFIVINFAADGYKQPQQLMILNYLLALGAEFDLVINLDGFNEVALPPSENIPNRVNPFYPRKWDRRTASAIDPTVLRLIGYLESSKESRQQWAETWKNRRLYLSPTLFLLWQFHDNRLAQKNYETSQAIITQSSKTQSYTMRGPTYGYASERDHLYRDLTELWKRSSAQMGTLSQANGAQYYHFLQPNQYVEGSKPMDDAERLQSVSVRSRFAEGATKGYPWLKRAGNELHEAGEHFSDLTMIFSDHAELLYIDDCCHTNREGCDIVARRIYDTIFAK